MDKISVIVPVYNTDKYLSDCIERILKQSYTNFEIILVDDGSTDSSKEICELYAQKDSRIMCIHKSNEGVSTARNEGIKHATGDYIVFIDSDDLIKRNLLEELSVICEADFSMCGYELYDDMLHTVTKQYICPKLSGPINTLANKIDNYISPPFLLGPCFKLFKKEIITKNKIQFPPEMSYGEDAVFVLNYLSHCKNVEIIEYIGYSYRKHGKKTLSTSFFQEKIDINHKINNLIVKLLKQERIPDEKIERIVSDRLLECFVSYTKELVNVNLPNKKKRVIFYEKYDVYKNKFGVPQRTAQRIILLAGKCKAFYPLIYLFKSRGCDRHYE